MVKEEKSAKALVDELVGDAVKAIAAGYKMSAKL